LHLLTIRHRRDDCQRAGGAVSPVMRGFASICSAAADIPVQGWQYAMDIA
jgi:hypothetical protein